MGGREKEGLERSWVRNKGNLGEAGDGGARWVSLPALLFARMWLWLLLTVAVLLQAKRNREHWFDDLPRTAFLIFKGNPLFSWQQVFS